MSLKTNGFHVLFREFVKQYFLPKARTPEEFAAAARMRYVSREALMKMRKMQAESVGRDNAQQLDLNHRFINMSFDAYVHGAYETTMELWSDQRGNLHDAESFFGGEA